MLHQSGCEKKASDLKREMKHLSWAIRLTNDIHLQKKADFTHSPLFSSVRNRKRREDGVISGLKTGELLPFNYLRSEPQTEGNLPLFNTLGNLMS